MRQVLLIPADTADESNALGIGPATQFIKLVIVNKEVLGAAGADDCLLAVSPGFAPLEDASECVAIPFA